MTSDRHPYGYRVIKIILLKGLTIPLIENHNVKKDLVR